MTLWLLAAVLATTQGVFYEDCCINGMSASMPMGCIFNNSTASPKRILKLVSFE
jgi:hypothetical protein